MFDNFVDAQPSNIDVPVGPEHPFRDHTRPAYAGNVFFPNDMECPYTIALSSQNLPPLCDSGTRSYFGAFRVPLPAWLAYFLVCTFEVSGLLVSSSSGKHQ